MAGASIETTLELWASSLRDVKARIRPLFRQERVAASAGTVSGWASWEANRARQVGCARKRPGDPGPWRQQAILGRGRWDADALRDIVRDYALETLADEDAVLVIDETGFLKQGKASCGVARQYTGSAGKITNCQIGVFASYVSRHGHAFIDRALYLPKAWTDDPERMTAAHVPDDVSFATKPQIARGDDRARDRRKGTVLFRCSGQRVWHGRDRDRCSARPAKVMFWALPPIMCSIPGARSRLVRRQRREDRAKSSQERMAAPVGGRRNQRPRLHDWAYLELADLDAGEYNSTLTGKWTRGLLIRRNIADGDLAFFSTWCPKDTPMKKLVSVEGHRWAIEDSFETAKNELGLDHNETRSWHGWHRHVSLVMLAFAMMAVIRHRANVRAAQKNDARVFGQNIVPDPLVDPGNPPHRHQARTTAHPTRAHHRMVTLATRPPSRSAPRPPQKENATVMLAFRSQHQNDPMPAAAWCGRSVHSGPTPPGDAKQACHTDRDRSWRSIRCAWRGSARPPAGHGQTPRPRAAALHPRHRPPPLEQSPQASLRRRYRGKMDRIGRAGMRCGSTSSCPQPSSALCCARHWRGSPRSAFR